MWAHAADHPYVAAVIANRDEVRDTGPHGTPPLGFLGRLLRLLRGRPVFLPLCGAP